MLLVAEEYAEAISEAAGTGTVGKACEATDAKLEMELLI
jgi:hypothetical protein